MTRLILARHGQTAWNRDVRFRGRADLPLDEVGRTQARALAEAVVGWDIQAIYASPLRRALETAQAARGLGPGLPVQPLEGLLDIDYGRWQGLAPDEAKAKDPTLYGLWFAQPEKARFPGGEGLAEVRARSLTALEMVGDRHPDGAVLLVSHEVVLKVLLCACLGLSNAHFWQIGQDVAAVNIVERAGGSFKVVLINDTCHLARVR